MLALVEDNGIVAHVPEGGWFTLPNGDRASPAEDGWTSGDCRLATIQPADLVPEGKRIASTAVELVAGVPAYVNVLEDVPPPSSEDINAERERRIASGATVTVTGAGDIPVQGRDVDVRNLQGLGLAALARVSAGDTVTITTFRDADNVDHELTPPQVLELVQKASAVAEAIIAASWAIKAMDPMPADVSDDGLWPAS
jgi:hypothetical protein